MATEVSGGGFPAQQSDRAVVFILSGDRSGSTWLGYVLGSIPQSAFLGEFYRAWNQDLRETCAWCTANGRPACGVLTDIERYPADQAFDIVFSRTRKNILIDNSKRTDWAERFIAPDSRFQVRFIHLIRDPRGWYASEQKRHPQARGEMIEKWLQQNLQIRNFLELSNIRSTTVFYEELAASPLSGFAQLCDSLYCTFEPSALRYWEKPHHGFAANGASSPLLNAAPHVSQVRGFATNDDQFYAANGRKSFVDQRWKHELSEEDALAITEDPRVAAFLNLYDRALTSGTLHHATAADRSLQQDLEGKFIRAIGNTPQLERIYLVRSGIRHWVPSMPVLNQLSKEWTQHLIILPPAYLETIPVGPPVRG